MIHSNPKQITERVRAVIIDDNRILLINRIKKDQTYWVVPGGKIELGESKEEAIKRECMEELGVTVHVKELFMERISDKPETIGHKEFFYLCDIVDGEIGTGQGPEFNQSGFYEGEHKIVWVDLKKILDIDLKPEEVKEKIIKIFL